MSLNCSLRLPNGSSFSAGYSPSPKSTWSYGGSKPVYTVGRNSFNSSGCLTNPSRSAQINANNAGALTRFEAQKMGLPLGGRK